MKKFRNVLTMCLGLMMVLTRAAFTFCAQVPKFRAACEKIGAEPVKYDDAGFRFDFIGGY